MKLIELSRSHFLVLGAVLLVAIPLCVVLAFGSDYLYFWYYETTSGLELQRAFGFEASILERPFGDTWAIAHVSPGGPFERGGVRAGDVPRRAAYRGSDGSEQWLWLRRHSQWQGVVAFYWFLGSQQSPLTFTVCSLETFDRFGGACDERSVTVIRDADGLSSNRRLQRSRSRVTTRAKRWHGSRRASRAAEADRSAVNNVGTTGVIGCGSESNGIHGEGPSVLLLFARRASATRSRSRSGRRGEVLAGACHRAGAELRSEPGVASRGETANHEEGR